jgi:hypothetical protein
MTSGQVKEMIDARITQRDLASEQRVEQLFGPY